MHIEKEESNLNHLRSNNFVITKSAYVFDSQVAKISTKGGGEGRGEGGGGGGGAFRLYQQRNEMQQHIVPPIHYYVTFFFCQISNCME